VKSTLAMICLAAALACGRGGAAGRASADPNALLPNGMSARQMIEARALHMKDLGGSFKAVRDQLASARPIPSLIRISAQEVEYAAQELPGWFPEGTGPETGLEMRALPEIWEDPQGFDASVSEFRSAAAELGTLAQQTDLEALRQGARAVGKTCAGCHDRYRTEEDGRD
jgi:cytochrome c556